MHIVPTSAADFPAIARVHRLAFGRDDEARLALDLLRDPTAQPSLSLLAYDNARPVGHILFTDLSLHGSACSVACAILAPLAVVPGLQRQGLGRALIERGVAALTARGVGLLFVLGDPDYYTGRGFSPASPRGLQAPYRIEPDEAWMVRPLQPDLLGKVRGTVSCAASLAAPEYWRE